MQWLQPDEETDLDDIIAHAIDEKAFVFVNVVDGPAWLAGRILFSTDKLTVMATTSVMEKPDDNPTAPAKLIACPLYIPTDQIQYVIFPSGDNSNHLQVIERAIGGLPPTPGALTPEDLKELGLKP